MTVLLMHVVYSGLYPTIPLTLGLVRPMSTSQLLLGLKWDCCLLRIREDYVAAMESGGY